jgi:hypothetical protein
VAELATRSVQVTRDRGALGVSRSPLNFLATTRTFEGALDVATRCSRRPTRITEATGTARIVFGRLLLAGFAR